MASPLARSATDGPFDWISDHVSSSWSGVDVEEDVVLVDDGWDAVAAGVVEPPDMNR